MTADAFDSNGADEPGIPWGKVLLVGGGVVVVGAACLVYIVGIGAGEGSTSDQAPGMPMQRPNLNTPFLVPGLYQPATIAAAEARIDEQALVLGVSAGGKHRAYLVSALGLPHHVINDLLDDVPVTVTYCDRTNCARVFTSNGRGAPLDLSLGGWFDDRMMLRLGSNSFLQDTGQPANADAVGVTDLVFERTTWKAWKTAHPGTDVFVGSSEKMMPPPGVGKSNP